MYYKIDIQCDSLISTFKLDVEFQCLLLRNNNTVKLALFTCGEADRS